MNTPTMYRINTAKSMNLKRLIVHTPILRLAVLMALSASALATTAVTGHITRLDTTTPGATAYVRFWLRGTRGNQPRITGTGAIAPQFSGSAFYVDLPADASGNISGTIYSTRDSTGTGAGDIEAGGSYTAVYYGMQIFNSGIAGPEIPVHAKSGGTLDIANVTPVSTLPVITSPSGDTTYARIDGGNTPFSGAVSFASTAKGSNINGLLYVGEGQYANIAAAVTAAGVVNNTIIVIPSTYGGSDCPASPLLNVTFLDYRGGNNVCSQNFISYNTTSGSGLVSMVRGIHATSSVTSAGNVSGYFQNILNNATCVGGCTTDGGSFELDIQGTFAGTMTVAQAAEQAVSVTSTGGTITQLNGVIGYLNNGNGSTTAITTFNGVYGAGCKSILGTPPVNCFGLYGEQQLFGSSRAYALGFSGPALAVFGSNANYGGIDAEDSAHAVHQWLLIDGINNTVMKAVNAAGIQLQSSGGTPQQTITSAGVKFPVSFGITNMLNSATAPTIASGFNTGSIGGSNGTASFFVVIGSGTAGSTGVLTLPAATVGWNCFASNSNRAAWIQQTANGSTSVTLTNFGTTFAATNWTNGDNIIVSCSAR